MPLLLLLLGLLVAPFGSWASPAVSCHCFKDREYDPSQPAAAEPYVLATARNSLLSAAFGIDKGQVVRKLMTGSSPDDLWVAYWAAAKTGTDMEKLLAAKGERGSWKATLVGSAGASAGATFVRALTSGAPDATLAAIAVDDVLVSRLKADPEAIKGLRAAGGASQDVILAVLLAPRARRVPSELFEEVKGGRKTWGGLLLGLGLAPRDVEPEIRRSLR